MLEKQHKRRKNTKSQQDKREAASRLNVSNDNDLQAATGKT